MNARFALSGVLGRAMAIAVVAGLMIGMSIPAVALAQPMPGSIKTTDATCAVVNANQYATRPDVYLDVDGEPDGDYYVRVEGPTGTTLGVTTTASLHVVGGEIVVNGAVVGCIQIWSLTQFAETDKPGGEYKALISINPAFPSNESKSDNFKVDSASLAIEKGVSLSSAGPFVASLTTTVGTTVHYRIVVTNTGNVALATFSVTDSEGLPPTCTIPPSLLVGATWTCNYSVTAAAGTVTNTAIADSAVTDPITDTATVIANPQLTSGMAIDKGVSLSPAGPFVASLTTTVGTTVHYRITVVNTGNVPLTGVTLADSDSTLAGCTIPTTLAVGASFTCDYSATATLGTNPNTATADSAETPSSSATATVIADPGAVIVVTPPPTASPTIAPTPTGSVAAVTSPPSPSGEVGGVTARPGEVTLPPTDADVTALSGGSSGVVPVLLILVGLALMGGAAILARPNGRRRSDRTR